MRSSAWIVGVAASVTATIADAQSATPTRHLDIGVSGSALYESNVSRTGQDFAVLRGIDPEDVTFSPAVTIDALTLIGRQSLSVTGSIGYDIYARNKQLNRERIELTGEGGLRFGRCNVTLNGFYARRQSDLGDLILVSPTIPLNQRVKNVEDIKTIGANAQCGGELGLRPTFGIQQSWVDNSSDVRRISDYNSTIYTGGVAYARPSFGLLTLFGRYETVTFPRRYGLSGLTSSDGFKSTGGGIRFERDIGSRLRGLVEFAYADVNPERMGVKRFSGPTWRLNLTAEPLSNLRSVVQVARTVSASNRVDANYVVERNYDLGLTYTVTERMSLVTGVLHQRRNYRGGFIVAGPSLTRDNLTTFSGGVNYRIGRRINAGLTVAQDIRHANGTLFDYKSTRFGVNVRTTF